MFFFSNFLIFIEASCYIPTLKFDLRFLKKSQNNYTKFLLDISKHVGEKCGKLADGQGFGEPESRTDTRMDVTP